MKSDAALLIMLKDHSGLEHGAMMRGVMWVLHRGGLIKFADELVSFSRGKVKKMIEMCLI